MKLKVLVGELVCRVWSDARVENEGTSCAMIKRRYAFSLSSLVFIPRVTDSDAGSLDQWPDTWRRCKCSDRFCSDYVHTARERRA